MKAISRRRFLKKAGQAGMAAAAGSAVRRFGIAQGEGPTRIVIDSGRQIGRISPRLYGSFLEHLGRAIYEGIYDPGSKLADANGFRVRNVCPAFGAARAVRWLAGQVETAAAAKRVIIEAATA